MRTNSDATGSPFPYALADRQQVYDLRIDNLAPFFGDDLNNSSTLDADDLANQNYGTDQNSPYLIAKDEEKNFAITYPDDSIKNQIYLFWRWKNQKCTSPRALEVKLKIDQAPAGTSDEYSALFKDPSCTNSIPNADTPVEKIASKVFAPAVPPTDLKTKMNILSLKVKGLALKPIGGVGNADLVFGFYQGGNAQVFGPTTNIESYGYFAGASRETTAKIDRQSGTILDLFQYVIFKKGS